MGCHVRTVEGGCQAVAFRKGRLEQHYPESVIDSVFHIYVRVCSTNATEVHHFVVAWSLPETTALPRHWLRQRATLVYSRPRMRGVRGQHYGVTMVHPFMESHHGGRPQPQKPRGRSAGGEPRSLSATCTHAFTLRWCNVHLW